jgi:putative membrane protein
MHRPLKALIAFIAAEHVGFCLMESVFWQHPVVMAALGTTPAIAASSQILATNQGLYNLFLSAGLVWGLRETDPVWQKRLLQGFLGFVFVAGMVGGITAAKSIWLTQALPAAIALAGLSRQEP